MRVDRAFAFVDLCGFTSFAEREGDETAVLVLAELRTMMREAAARRGVRVVKWLGDGAMLSSTMPDAVAALTVEVDRRMRRSVPSLALRAGMDNGPVIMFEGDDYIGRPVNVASRLCDAAAAHEVLATAVVATTLPSWITARPGPRLRPPGFDVDLDVCRLEVADPAPAPAATDPACGLTLARSQMLAAPSGEWYCSEACAGTERATVPA